jgi:hypothetical protein
MEDKVNQSTRKALSKSSVFAASIISASAAAIFLFA